MPDPRLCSLAFGALMGLGPWDACGLVGPLPYGWCGGECPPLMGLWTLADAGASCDLADDGCLPSQYPNGATERMGRRGDVGDQAIEGS